MPAKLQQTANGAWDIHPGFLRDLTCYVKEIVFNEHGLLSLSYFPQPRAGMFYQFIKGLGFRLFYCIFAGT